MYFQIYSQIEPRVAQQWRWRLKAANHETLASGEGYSSRDSCLWAIGLLMDTTRNTPVYAA